MYYTASEMYRVICTLACDERVGFFKSDVFKPEQRHCELADSTAHLNCRVACFGIDSACVCNAHGEVNIAHYLGENEVGNVLDAKLLACFSVEEIHPFERRCFDVGRGEPVCKRIDTRDDVSL